MGLDFEKQNYKEMIGHLRSFDVAKTGSFHLKIAIALLGGIDNFLANILPFTVTIGPDDEHTSIPGLIRKVLGNVFLVLEK